MNKQQFGIFYQFKKSSWGHGYAKESVKWLLSYMKKYENAVILADVVTDNTASEKILINCGFKLCSTTNSVVHGQEVTINNYELKLK